MAATTWLEEMKRRRVFRTLVGYGIFSFGVLQVVEPIMHGLSLPDWVLTFTVIGLGLGFPIALVLAWAFDINDGRIERSGPFPTARLLLLLIAGGLALGAPGVAWHFWKLRAQAETAESSPAPAARAPASRSIAVLPFVNMSADPENDFFADGLSEEILNSLARIDGLQVVGRTSSFQFKGKPADLRAVGSRLGAAHVLEGSVRKSGERARITAQLIRVADGFHVWSQTYDRTLTDVLAVQLDIADHVAGALDVLLDERSAPACCARASRAWTRSSLSRRREAVSRSALEQQEPRQGRAAAAGECGVRARDRAGAGVRQGVVHERRPAPARAHLGVEQRRSAPWRCRARAGRWRWRSSTSTSRRSGCSSRWTGSWSPMTGAG